MFQDSGADTMLVPVGINGTRISAVVDTVVQVTVMNPETCQTLGLVESSSSEVVQLRNAQKESVMSGHLWKHVGLRLGGRKYYLDIVEADINDSFILGMDFLQQHHCKIDLGQNVLEMGDGEKIYATMRGRKKTGCYNVSRVTLEKKAKIPPSSIKICLAKMNNPADVPFLLEGEIHDDVYVLPLLIQGSDFVNVCVVNLSDVPVCLRRHTLLAKAVEVDAMLDPHGAASGDGAQGPVVYVRGDDFDGHIDAELPSICRVESTEDGSEVQFFSAESQDGSLDTSVDVKVRPSRDSVSSDGSSLEGTCSHVTAGLPTPNGAEGRSLLLDEAKANDTQTRRLPAHLQSMYDDAATRLSEEQAARLHELLLDFADVFAAHDLDIGEFTTLVHWIKTGMAFPILQQMRRTPLGFEGEEKKHLEAMLAAKVIEPSVSEWASPPVLVRKHGKSWRYCIDFRALNSVTERDAYPLPLIEECIDSLDGMRWFCTLDMNSGYWQIPIAEEDKKKTAFLTRYGLFQFLRMRWFCTLDMNLGYWQIPIAEEDKKKTAFLTRYGLFQFLRMPFGLSNAPATFQRAMHLVLAGLIWESVIVYLDDINVMGKTFDQTLANLEIVLKRFRKFGLKLKPRKCALFCTEIKFLGRKIDANGVHVTADHIQTVLDWPKPKNRKELESFLGFVNYHREFMCGLAEKSSVLYQLTGANSEWVWDEQHTEAFKLLKKAVTELPVLGFPNSRDQFILDRARLQTFEEGDVVYRRNTARKPGQSRKLAPLYEGPFLVLRALTNSLYLVADQKRMQTWHHDKLRMCHESPLPTWLLRQRNLLMHGEHPFLKDLDSRSESSKVGAGTGCTVMVAPRTNDEGVMDSGCTVMVTPRTNDEGVMDSGCTVMVAPADNEGPSDSGELQGEAVSWCTVMVAPGSASLEELDPDLDVTLPYREDECVEESADEEESLHDLDLAQLFKAPRVSRTGCHIRTPRHLEDFV